MGEAEDIEKERRHIENGLQAFRRINGGRGSDNLNKRSPRKSNNEYKHIQNDRFPGKNTARDITRYAIRRGLITKTPCEICGALEVEAHHSDYTKPLEVIFLCKKHHMERHKNGSSVKADGSSTTPDASRFATTAPVFTERVDGYARCP